MLKIDANNYINKDRILAIVKFEPRHYNEEIVIDVSKGKPRSTIYTKEGITFVSMYNPWSLQKFYETGHIRREKNEKRKTD